MDHLTDRQLGDYLDGRLSDVEEARVEGHLETCPPCREEVERLRWASDRLSRDAERAGVPPELKSADVWPEAVGARPSWIARRLRHPVRAAAAALLLFTIVAAGSAALPGSPVRPLAERLLNAVPGVHLGDEEADSRFGLEVRPVSGRIDVQVVRPAPGTILHVTVVDDSSGGAWSSTGRLRSAPGRIEIQEPGGGTVEVALPRSADLARVLSDDEEVAVWSDGDLRIKAPIRGSMEDGYRIELSSRMP